MSRHAITIVGLKINISDVYVMKKKKKKPVYKIIDEITVNDNCHFFGNGHDNNHYI